MTSLEQLCAALAAALTDNELAWRFDRLPDSKDYTPLQRAVLHEAQRRGLRNGHPSH